MDYSYLPYATSYGYNLPAPHVVAAPAVQQVVQPVVQPVAAGYAATVPFGSSSGLDPITQGLDAATQGVVEAAPVVAAPAAA